MIMQMVDDNKWYVIREGGLLEVLSGPYDTKTEAECDEGIITECHYLDNDGACRLKLQGIPCQYAEADTSISVDEVMNMKDDRMYP